MRATGMFFFKSLSPFRDEHRNADVTKTYDGKWHNVLEGSQGDNVDQEHLC